MKSMIFRTMGSFDYEVNILIQNKFSSYDRYDRNGYDKHFFSPFILVWRAYG